MYIEDVEGAKVRRTKSVNKISQQSRNVGTKAVLTGYITVICSLLAQTFESNKYLHAWLNTKEICIETHPFFVSTYL